MKRKLILFVEVWIANYSCYYKMGHVSLVYNDVYSIEWGNSSCPHDGGDSDI